MRISRPATPSRHRLPAGLLAAVAALLSSAAHATVQTLTDTEMSRVNARGTANDGSQPQLPLPPALSQIFASSTATVSFQDAKSFAVDLRALGLEQPFTAPFYDGRPVLKAQLAGPPVDVQFDLSQFFLASAPGVTLGTVQLRQLNTTGTSLWIWGH